MLLTNKVSSKLHQEELPRVPNSNVTSCRANTPNSSTSSKLRMKKNKMVSKPIYSQMEELNSFVNSDLPKTHRNVNVGNYSFASRKITSVEPTSHIMANFPDIKQ